MKIEVSAERPENGKLVANLVVSAADVDQAIAKEYKNVASKYNFQGFRRGRAPRPVIDSMLGKEAVLAQATENLLQAVTPLMLEELDAVAISSPDFGEDLKLLEEHADFKATANISVPPTFELDSYDAPAINMPPEEVTEGELKHQLDELMRFQVSYEEDTEDRALVEGDSCQVSVEKLEDKDALSYLLGEKKSFILRDNYLPKEFIDGLIGMKKGESKEIVWDESHGEHEHHYGLKVTVDAIQKEVMPALDDELAKKFGFDSVDELKASVKDEIAEDKKNALPNLKEDRVVIELGKRLADTEIPQVYVDQVYNELAQEFLGQMQRQGVSLDMYLASRNIKVDEFLNDLREQADERARQSLALDALATKLAFDATDEDIKAEFERAGVPDVEASIKEFVDGGRMPAVRESIRRSKAVNWLVEHAEVSIVDEFAEEISEK